MMTLDEAWENMSRGDREKLLLTNLQCHIDNNCLTSCGTPYEAVMEIDLDVVLAYVKEDLQEQANVNQDNMEADNPRDRTGTGTSVKGLK